MTTAVKQSLTTGIISDNLKLSKVLPLFKKGDPTSVNNYRPISLLPALSKILERVIHNQINNYFTLNNLYYKGQYGFRHKHLTELAALDTITSIMVKRQYTDDHISGLMQSIWYIEPYNFRQTKILRYSRLFIEFNRKVLKNWKQSLEINNIRSAFTNILTGVLQGSTLGPRLFIIYMSDIPFASTILKTIIYADDTTLLTNLSDFYFKNNTKLNMKIINSEFNRIKLWLRANKITLNTQKSQFMLFCQLKKRLEIPKIEINKEKIECVEQFDFQELIYHFLNILIIVFLCSFKILPSVLV